MTEFQKNNTYWTKILREEIHLKSEQEVRILDLYHKRLA
jgi:hypothetical protein